MSWHFVGTVSLKLFRHMNFCELFCRIRLLHSLVQQNSTSSFVQYSNVKVTAIKLRYKNHKTNESMNNWLIMRFLNSTLFRLAFQTNAMFNINNNQFSGIAIKISILSFALIWQIYWASIRCSNEIAFRE